MSSVNNQPAGADHLHCLTHGGAAGFTNAALTKINGDIELDPHAVRACVLRFDEHGATALRDTLTAWLG